MALKTVTGGALCSCGRPMGHTGKHTGSLAAKRGGQGFGARIATERAALADRRDELREMIRSLQAELLAIDPKLDALTALEAAYAPAATHVEKQRVSSIPPSVTTAAPRVGGHEVLATKPAPPRLVPPASREPPEDQTEADYAPVAASWNTVKSWADEHRVLCHSWDGLPQVNRAREMLNLPTFKRQFAMGRAG